MADLPDRIEAERLLPDVSRETWDRWAALLAQLHRWQPVLNLVSPTTLAKAWVRHIADSAQLLALAPAATRWVDLGSGAGFPGLVVAARLADTPGAEIHLVESDQRKAAFLRETARVLALPAIVHASRIGTALTGWTKPVDAVTARALAPLPRLLDLAEPLLQGGARGLFLKGADAARELTDSAQSWNIRADLVPSLTHPEGRVVVVEHLSRRRPDAPS